MNTAKKGRNNEYKSIRIFEAAGYVCTRAAASKGHFDIIGVGATDIVLVQCKSNQWPSEAEMESLREFKAPANCKKLVHRWRDRSRTPDVREL